ncbi:MAG: hypothetical protein MUF54_17895 [Polyangiaceae bacterium]|jgi:hypothetical protein|nr:hypothetical protein [Polyangiaceae bacterium]
MRSLLENHGLPTVKPALRYLAIRVQAHPETEHLGADLEAERKRLANAEEQHEDAFERWLGAAATVRHLDRKLGKLVLRLSRDTLVLVDGNRKDTRYQRLFATSPSEGMRGIGGDPQELYVRTLLTRMKNDDAYVSLRGHLPALTSELDVLNGAVASRDELRLKQAMAQRDLRMAVDSAKRTYNLLQARLRLIFPDDPELVKTFFRTLTTRSADTTEEDPTPEAPVEPSEPTPAQ